jgi:hypothetical protein
MVDCKTGDQPPFPMYMAFTKVQVSFIAASVAGRHIRLNLLLLLSQIESYGAITVIYVAMNTLNGCDGTTHLYIFMGTEFLAEVWAIEHNPTVIDDHILSPVSWVWYSHWGTNTSPPAIQRLANMS